MLNHGEESRHADRGDTLIELLVALVIVGLAVVALIGGLMTSTATSSTHRNLVTLDGALRAFGSSLQSAVSNQLGGSSSTVIAYAPCAATYQFAGPMYPETQSVGGLVSIPVMGLSGSMPVTATIGSSTVSAGTTSTSGAAVATFPAPNLPPGAYAVSLSDGTTNISAGSLTIGSTGNSDALGGQYSLTTQVTPVGGSCTSTHLQQAVLTLANTQVNSGAADSVTVFLADTRNIAVPTETVTGPSSPQALGQPITFIATVAGSGTPPTGSVTWTFPDSPSGTTCTGGTTTALSGGSASCNIAAPGSPPVAGTYTAVAVYTPDSNSTYSGTSAESSPVTVSKGTATVTTAATSGSPAQVGSTLTFSATVSGVPGITPTGSIVWSWPGAPAGAVCVGGNTTTLSSGTTSCSVTPALPGTYNPTATYQADSGSSYTSGVSGNQASTTVSIRAPSTTTVTPSDSSAATGSNITFTATVSGGIAVLPPTGQVIWTFQAGAPSGAACSGGNTTTLTNGTTTCVVSNAKAGTYSPTAAYQGDANYTGSSSPANQSTIVVGNETPTITVTGVPGLSGNGSKADEIVTFTATVIPQSTTDPHPTGTVSWMVTGGATSCTTTQPLSDDHPGNTSSATCVIDPSVPTSSYTATATYSGDSYYNPVVSAPAMSTG